ncbi:(2Fe-2S)-binding protein [Streptomyces peucetius subsp. caesius ATCC 27952]|nr:(2Fe-2S)-binding protein [Streptomyces peucetius subsp. caesius ATCC 27952]
MSNEDNPLGLPPEFRQPPEGYEPEHRGDHYEGHAQSEQPDPYGSYDSYGSYTDQGGGWQPTPQGGEYDGEATAFFQLPPEVTSDAAPLEAPGHGFVPPMITPLVPAAGTDPGATGGWEPQWPEPAAHDASHASQGPSELAEAGATGQWTFHDSQQTEPAASYEGDSDSGEFPLPPGADATWAGTTPPATLPGGAPAPWATLPGGAPAPWAEQPRQEEQPEPAAAEPVEEPPASAPAPTDTAQEAAEPSPEPEPEPEVTSSGPGSEPEATSSGTAPEVVPDEPPAAPVADGTPAGNEEHPPTSYVLRVNGTDRPVSDAWIGESLLYVLRERLGLAGAKDGCSQGECGACNVQVDGRLVASCLVPAATAAGSEVRTVEGLATDGEPSDVQRALAACGAVQCGFCIPGMAMTVHDLLEGNHAPTELETRQALCGNLCRCSGYRGVLDAVHEVVAERAASAAALSEASASDTADAGEEARIPHQAPPGAGSVQIHPHDGGMA